MKMLIDFRRSRGIRFAFQVIGGSGINQLTPVSMRAYREISEDLEVRNKM